jgi:DNA-binding MarR family transcriptional regulator
MARGSQETHAERLRELARELRQFYGLGASFFRAAAGQIGMTVTDMHVLDLLENSGPMTAGQIADLTGLTTGAITGMLNRLEEAGRVRRERDPDDARRVIVRLESGKDDRREIGPIFASLEKTWEELASRYDDEQITFLLEFLKQSNALSRQELVRLRAAPEGEGGSYSAPLGALTSGQLVVSRALRLTLRAGEGMDELYQARFEGPLPEVKAKEGVVTISYPRRLLLLPASRQGAAEVTLSTAIPWQIIIQGGVLEITAGLGGLILAGLEIKGGMSTIRLELPLPSGTVPIRFSGGASDVTIRRPAGVAARVHLKGWVSTFIFDDQTFSNVGSDVRLQSRGYEGTASRYDIDVASSASMVTITSG